MKAKKILVKKFVVLFCCTLFSVIVFCQPKDLDFKFGNVTAKDFDVSGSKIVSADDDAVVLYSAGSTHFIGNNQGWFSYVYTRTERIKIINKKAFDAATVRIGLYSKDNRAEVLSNVKANTYNINGVTVTSVSLGKNDIFSEEEDKNHILKKFTLPGIQEGCIIEFTYTITSPYTFNMPSWQFQSIEYPVLWSEYKVSIPSALIYVSIQQGFDSYYLKQASQGTETYAIINPADKGTLGAQDQNLTVSAVTNNFRWVEKDLAPLKVESYVSSPENYVDKIEFQLSQTYNGEDKHDVVNTWQSACKEFFQDEDFQQAVSHDNSWIKDIAADNNAQSNLDEAKNIYYYLQSNYACTDTSDIFKQSDLYDVYKKQKGSIRSINLLLTAMLNNKNIYAQPVMLSTRENGLVDPNYPVIDRFNYLICRAVIDGKTYLLDATNPILGFGKLPLKCYNGYARVIDETRPDSLYLQTDSLKESQISSLFLSNDADGKISGTYKCTMGEIQSAQLREEMQTTNTEEYFKNLKKEYPFDISINNTKIDSLNQKEKPIFIQYDISFKADEDIIYLNPILGDKQNENPFKAAQRSYPVEMPYCLDKTYIFNMQVPSGYKVDEMPKSSRVSLNGNDGMFEYLIQQNNDQIQMRYRIKLNKATFTPDDYETLRNFYAFIVEKESEQIVFKKL